MTKTTNRKAFSFFRCVWCFMVIPFHDNSNNSRLALVIIIFHFVEDKDSFMQEVFLVEEAISAICHI